MRRFSAITRPASAVVFLTAIVSLVLTGCSPSPIDGAATRATSDDSQVTPQPIPTIVVLDASDSMNTADAPGPRIDAAKKATVDLSTALPPETDFGVVAFGSTLPAEGTPRRRGCTDVVTAIPLGPLTATSVSAQLASIRAQGFTPIGNALQTAVDQLPSTGPASIVLISDGEPTCAPDPCETAKAIHTTRPDVTVSAVGFRTDAPSLACVATNGGGLFVTADNAAQLSARLTAAQNSRDAATRLSTTSRGDISLGDALSDIRAANPDFPTQPTSRGDRTVYVWRDCTYTFDSADELVEIAPGDPPGSAGITIDGVTRGTPGTRAIELYGDPWSDTDGVALFPADEGRRTGYRLGYEGGKSIKDGTVTTVILCGCLPASKPAPAPSGPATEVVTVIAVDKKGTPINGFRSAPSVVGTFMNFMESCQIALGARTEGLYRCGTTADGWAVCWKKTAQWMLCSRDPWDPVLSPLSYSADELPDVTPSADPVPWAVELSDGTRCLARNGGAWPKPPEGGFEFSYSCRLGSKYTFLFSRNGTYFDKSAATWTAYHGDGETGTPTPVPIKKVYFSAAE